MPTRAPYSRTSPRRTNFSTPDRQVIGFDANGDTTAPMLTLKKMATGGKTETVAQLTLN